EMTAQKFLPEFTFEELKAAGLQAGERGAELDALKPSLFDAAFEPTIPPQSPQGNRDILQSSANNFYRGLSLADLKGFQEKYPLNSRLVKDASGKLVEEVYRAGTPDGKIPAGRYARYLAKASEYLEKARAVADPEQAGDRVGAQQRAGGFRQWLHRGLPRRASRQGHVAELRLHHRREDESVDAQAGGQRPVFRGSRPLGAAVQEAGREGAHGEGVRDAHRDRGFSRRHGGRQFAQRERDPGEVRQQELPVYGQFARAAPGDRLRLAGGICGDAGRDCAGEKVRRRGQRPADGAARDHRARLWQA